MTRLLLITLLLLLCSGPAYAEWVKVVSAVDAGFIAYADPDTIRRKGDLVKMWNLFDSKTADSYIGNSFLSIRGQSEFDCAEELTRPLAETGLSGNMGRGKPVYSKPTESKWTPVAPGSVARALWEFASEKK